MLPGTFLIYYPPRLTDRLQISEVCNLQLFADREARVLAL